MKQTSRHPARTVMIFVGILLVAGGTSYLLAGLAGLAQFSAEALAWNNIRIIAGAAVLGCLMAAVGYGNE